MAPGGSRALFWDPLSVLWHNYIPETSICIHCKIHFKAVHRTLQLLVPFSFSTCDKNDLKNCSCHFCFILSYEGISSTHFTFSIIDWLPQLWPRAWSQLTAVTSSIISTRGRALSEQGHQGAAAEVPLFIYFPPGDSVIHKVTEWQPGQCQPPGTQWRLYCIDFWAHKKPLHYKRVIIVLNRLIHAER